MPSKIDAIHRILAMSVFDLNTEALGQVRCGFIATIIQNNVFLEQIKTADLDGPTLVRRLLCHIARRIHDGVDDNNKDETGELLSESDVRRLTDTEIESFSHQIYVHNTWLFETHEKSEADSSAKAKILPKDSAERDSDYLVRALRVHMMELDTQNEKLIKRLRNTEQPFRHVGLSISRLQKDFDRINQSFKPLVDFHRKIENTLEPLRRLREQIGRSMLVSKRMIEVVQANQNLQHIIDQTAASSRLATDLTRAHHTWLRDLTSVQDQAAALQVAANLSLGKMAYRLTVSECMFARVDILAISQSIALPENAILRLRAFNDDLTATYRKLAESFRTYQDIIHLPKFVLPGATREVFFANHALNKLGERDEADSEQSLAELTLVEEAIEETSNCPALLRDVDPQLVKMYEGALGALRDDNPDRKRHVLSSLRELVNHLLWKMAPDEKVLAWIPATNGNWLHEEKPTRNARLRYLCREIEHGPMDDFVIADTKAMVKFIEILNRTHQLEIALSSQQLQALLHRTASFVTFIVPIWKESK